MNVRLLYRDRDSDLERRLPANAEALAHDLELATIYEVMADGDAYLRDRAEETLLALLLEPEAILYRQGVLRDCLEQPDAVRALYALAIEGLETKRKVRFFWFRDSPDAVLGKSLGMLELLIEVLRRLRIHAEQHAAGARSEGLTRLLGVLAAELDDEYLETVESHLRELRFRDGALVSARLGPGNRGMDYTLRRPRRTGWLERLPTLGRRGFTFTVAARDEHGLQTIAELRGRGINRAANALAQSVDHILAFLGVLRAELAFYVGCLNLYDQLTARRLPVAFPAPRPSGERAFAASGLADAPLAFHAEGGVVGNDVSGDGVRLTVVTGANQGGKSTFLRSVGVAQLMMQAGMFVAADSYRASVANGIFTHFTREEDPDMKHGKLDEELSRMSDIVDVLQPGSLLLCNESFAATNEREGSEIASQVARALVEGGVRVVYVTHLYDLASRLHAAPPGRALFLRAERKPDGSRTFRVVPGEPEATSYAADSFQRVFGTPLESVRPAAVGDS